MSVPPTSDRSPERSESYNDAFGHGFELGAGHGWDLGWHAGYTERSDEFDAILAGIVPVFRQELHDELERRRVADHQPCPRKCGRCSRCFHSKAYWARGGRDYLGVEGEARLASRGAA